MINSNTRNWTVLLLCTLLVKPCLADDTDEEIRESKVYETIGEMVVRRDELLKKFAVVMHGESLTIRGEANVNSVPAINARMTDRSRGFDLRSGYLVLVDFGPQAFESGRSTIQVGKVHKVVEHNPLV
ncbi:MAG: hypothetical protein MI861_18490, partial [Pirellulales bacterium]|nr:hypothetical protein [Pirellulales bacterium]